LPITRRGLRTRPCSAPSKGAAGWEKIKNRISASPPIVGVFVPRRKQPVGAMTRRMYRNEASLFDDLVDEQWHHIGNGQAERLGGLEVDHQLEPGRLDHRKSTSRLRAVPTLLALAEFGNLYPENEGWPKGRKHCTVAYIDKLLSLPKSCLQNENVPKFSFE